MGDIRSLTGVGPTGGVRQFNTPAPFAGQPVRTRMWGIPTMPGWMDRAGKWNFIGEPRIGWALISILLLISG